MATYNFRRISLDVLTAHDPNDFSDGESFLHAVLLDLLHKCPFSTARNSALVKGMTTAECDTLEQFVFQDAEAMSAAIALGMEPDALAG